MSGHRAAVGERPDVHPRGGQARCLRLHRGRRRRGVQSAIEITLQRFAKYHNLQGAFGRRAVIEQAKGILMARHGIDQEAAFVMLRSHSQRTGRKVVDVADAVVESHLLLLPSMSPTAVDEVETA